jgi:hypothetical protein
MGSVFHYPQAAGVSRQESSPLPAEPAGYEIDTNALTVKAKKEAPPGFEPGNKGFADLCLTTWLWRPKQKAGNETRTRDSHLGKVVLYQLSYSRIYVPALSSYYKLYIGKSNCQLLSQANFLSLPPSG